MAAIRSQPLLAAVLLCALALSCGLARATPTGNKTDPTKACNAYYGDTTWSGIIAAPPDKRVWDVLGTSNTARQ